MSNTPSPQARAVLDYLLGHTAPDVRLLCDACRRIIAAGEAADPADLVVLGAEIVRRRHAEARLTGDGMAMIDDRVI